jgi:hypothetical protein
MVTRAATGPAASMATTPPILLVSPSRAAASRKLPHWPGTLGEPAADERHRQQGG